MRNTWTALAFISLTVAAMALVVSGPDTQAASARSKCARAGGPGLIGEEVLLEQGFTTGEVTGVAKAVDHLAQRICPFPEFVDIVEGSLHQTHVDHDTVWKYTFTIDASPGRNYRVTCLMPNLDRMTVIIRSTSGKVLYRAHERTPGI